MKQGWWKLALLGGLGVVVLLGALAAWFVATFDAERYKGLAIDWMKREHDRTLALDGPIRLSLLPRLELRASKLRLSEKGKPAETFASIDEAGLAVQWAPLLSKRLVVERVSAQGVQATYARDAQGRSNLDDLLGEKPGDAAKPSGGAASAPGAPALDFDVSGLDIRDVKLVLRDAKTPLAGELTLVSLRSGRLASGVAAPVTLEAQLGLAQPAVRGRLDGALKLTLDAPAKAVTLQDAALAFKGDAAGVQALDLKLAAERLAYAGASGALEAQALALDLGGARLGTLELAAGSKLRLARVAYDPAAQALAVAKLALDVAGRDAQQPLSLSLDWPSLEVKGENLRGSPLQGRAKLEGTNALDARFASGAPTGRFEQIRLPGVTVSLKGRNGPRAIDGELKTELLLEPKRSAASLDKLALDATVQEPGQPALALAARGSAHASAREAGWKLDGSLNQNRFESSGSARFADEGKSSSKAATPPTIEAQARFDSLDLNKLLPPPSAAASAPGAGSGGSADATPVDLAGLKAVNGSFALRAASLVYRQYRLADARLDAKLAQGRLDVPTLQAKVWGGSLEASAFAEAASQRVGVKLAGSGVDVNALLRDVAAYDRLEGKGHVTADVQARGKTVGELRRSLAGTAALQLRDGAIKGINLAKTLRQAKAALSLRQDAVQRGSQTEKTDFSELSASFRIADGVARNDDLDMKSPFLRVGGAGTLDLGKGRIDYTAKASVIGSPAGQDGADMALLKGLTVPVLLSGPFEAVDWHVQWSAVAAGALKNQLQDKLGEALGQRLGGAGAKPAPGAASAAPAAPAKRPEDALKDRLKGLLGR